jgi:predicted methyltransferase
MVKWSQQQYKTLTPKQHQANNEWFEAMTRRLKPGGVVYVPNLGKKFTANGEETA